jgi:N-acyl-D-aspartate/D-glutamate deacylase
LDDLNDLPEGAHIRHARGIRYTIVNGSVLMENGAHTGTYPGKELRSQAI